MIYYKLCISLWETTMVKAEIDKLKVE